jgi:hypothetical protein
VNIPIFWWSRDIFGRQERCRTIGPGPFFTEADKWLIATARAHLAGLGDDLLSPSPMPKWLLSRPPKPPLPFWPRVKRAVRWWIRVRIWRIRDAWQVLMGNAQVADDDW